MIKTTCVNVSTDKVELAQVYVRRNNSNRNHYPSVWKYYERCRFPPLKVTFAKMIFLIFQVDLMHMSWTIRITISQFTANVLVRFGQFVISEK